MNLSVFTYRLKQDIKPILYRLGLFRIARNLFLVISKHHRTQRQNNKSFYKRFIQNGDLCFDVGANLGQTVEALLASGGRVISIEPNPKCYDILAKQYAKHPQVVLRQLAIGEGSGTATLNFQGTESTASLLPDWPYHTDESTEVSITTLDKVIEEHGIPKLIKVDVEGFEREVFSGLNTPIEYIIFEVHRTEKRLAEDVLERLRHIGTVSGICAINGDCSKWLIDNWIIADQVDQLWSDSADDYANIVVKMSVQ